jgi:hypothetical protein
LPSQQGLFNQYHIQAHLSPASRGMFDESQIIANPSSNRS